MVGERGWLLKPPLTDSKVKVKPPQILGFLHIGIVQLISEPKGKNMNLQFFPKKFQKVKWGQRKNSNRERQKRLKMLDWHQE